MRWEPFRELATLQTELSRLMNGCVLEIRIAKPAVKKPRRIAIGGEDASPDRQTIDGNAASS